MRNYYKSLVFAILFASIEMSANGHPRSRYSQVQALQVESEIYQHQGIQNRLNSQIQQRGIFSKTLQAFSLADKLKEKKHQAQLEIAMQQAEQEQESVKPIVEEAYAGAVVDASSDQGLFLSKSLRAQKQAELQASKLISSMGGSNLDGKDLAGLMQMITDSDKKPVEKKQSECGENGCSLNDVLEQIPIEQLQEAEKSSSLTMLIERIKEGQEKKNKKSHHHHAIEDYNDRKMSISERAEKKFLPKSQEAPVTMSRVQNDAPSELDDDIAGALDNPLSSYYAAMHPEILEKAKERTY